MPRERDRRSIRERCRSTSSANALGLPILAHSASTSSGTSDSSTWGALITLEPTSRIRTGQREHSSAAAMVRASSRAQRLAWSSHPGVTDSRTFPADSRRIVSAARAAPSPVHPYLLVVLQSRTRDWLSSIYDSRSVQPLAWHGACSCRAKRGRHARRCASLDLEPWRTGEEGDAKRIADRSRRDLLRMRGRADRLALLRARGALAGGGG